MNFSFAWIDTHESFDPQLHCKEEEKIFSLQIRQREGGLAAAQITVANPKVGLLGQARKRYGLITYQKQLIFRGRVVGMPVHIEGEAVRLLLIAQPEDYHRQLQQLMQTLKTPPYWDELFVHDATKYRPLEALEARSALYYCSRTSGKVSISDIFTGNQHIDLGGNFFRNSLQVRVNEAPLSSVTVELSAQWSQQGYGTCDITPQLLAQFPYGLLSTYTGKDLEAKWWKQGEKIGRTGYWVESSYLKEVSPPYTGILNLYPKLSPKLWAPAKKVGEPPQQIRLKRHWYQAELRLGWHYQQTRCEVARFTLNHSTQPLMPASPRTRHLRFRLQKIVGLSHAWRAQHGYTRGFRVVHEDKIYRCLRRHRSGEVFENKYWRCLGQGSHSDPQSSRANFFTTDRGRQAILHSLERAKAHLAASARAITIKLHAPFDTLCNITTDHSVTVADERLPGGRATGKVMGYRLCVEGKSGKRWVEVELGVSIGAKQILFEGASKPTSLYVESNYVQPDFQVDLGQKTTTQSGVELGYWRHQGTSKGVLYPSALKDRDFLQDIEVQHDPDTQLQHMLQNQYPRSFNLKHTLLQKPTNLCLQLKDLSTQPRLTHEVVIPVLSSWSPMRQIDLETGMTARRG
ncbi:MAG: hypothetical protein ABFQ95_06020 [Pseudomonadota bacterium]